MNRLDTARFAAALSGPADVAVTTISEMVEEARQDDDQAMVAQLAVEAALLYVKLGDIDSADVQMTAAMAAATASGSDVVRLIVAWRYVAMLSMLDQPAQALRYAQGLQASLDPSAPLPVRIVGLSVAGTVAASSGQWREVQRLSQDLLTVASAIQAGEDGLTGESVKYSLVAQGHLGIAEASIRLERTTEAVHHAMAAFDLARRHRLPNIGASALGVLFVAEAVPHELDIVSWLESAYESHERRGDLLGEIGAGLMLAWFYRERGNHARAAELFDRIVAAAETARQGFAWAKALIWRAQLRVDVNVGLAELTQGWAVLREIAGAVAEPDARQALLIDWRTLADETLAWLYERCPRPLPSPAGQLAVTVMTALTGDGVAAALRQTATDPPTAAQESLSIDDLGNALAGRWNAEQLVPADTLDSLSGCDVVAYRVLEARPELLSGWRLHIDPSGVASVERFKVEGAAAFEIKRLAEGDPRAPSAERAVWRQVGEALLPHGLAIDDSSELLVIPHGPLWLVPFAALEVEGKAMIDHRTLSYLPSLAHPRSRTFQLPRSAVALVDPTLLGIELELQALRDVVGEPPATTGRIDELDTYLRQSPEILFIGAHGGGRGPRFCLELPAEQLSLERFLAWRLPAWVIASSCLSGRHNAEVWPPSLVTVCRLQGASHVLGAVWEVPSRRTAEIVSQTIRNVGRGDHPALALRKAQQKARDRGSLSVKVELDTP